MAFSNGKKHLNLERDTLHVGLGAGLLQMRDGMQFPRNEASDNAALCPITFASKSLPSAENHTITT